MLKPLIGALVVASALGAALPARADAKLEPLLLQLREQDLARGAWALQQGESIATARLDADGEPPAYRIGSISKVFTAVLALQLVEQGRLQLDAPLSRWFPALPQAQAMTVAQLLRHRSGLGDVKDAPDFEAWARQPRSLDDLVALIGRLPRQAEPDTRTQYNNSGYILLHALVERAGAAPYEAQLAARITAPLGLRQTRMAQAGEGLGSFGWDGQQWRPLRATDPSVPRGAGALVSTPAELTRFIRALFKGRLLQAQTLAQMLTLQDGFGLGIAQAPQPKGQTVYGHEGVIDGFRAALVYLPQQDLAAAVLLNAEHWPRDALLAALLQSRLDPAQPLPDLRPKAQDWALQVAPLPLQPGQRLALRGSQPPLRWDAGLPLQPTPSGWQLALHWQGVAGLPLQAKLVVENEQGEVLRWERGDNRRWFVDQPPTQALRFDLKGEQEALWHALLAADAAMFAAFNRRDAAALAPFFSERLEFFHDLGGLADKAQTLRQLTQNFARSELQLRRELVPEGLQIYPLPGIGAMQIGQHRFCRRENGGPEQCQQLGFSTVWERSPSGQWQQLRVMSYAH